MDLWTDLLVLTTGWALSQALFNGYEAHVRWSKRLGKFVTIALVFAAVHFFIGRVVFYGLLALMTAAIAVLHGYWFHHRNGIHWRTAEPRARYLELIGERKPED